MSPEKAAPASFANIAFDTGRIYERKRISDWIDAHRRAVILDDDCTIWRDSFNSEELLDFIHEEESDGTK